MITKVVLNNVASYKRATILETDKRLNLVYGLNGVGKSTFSDLLYDQHNPRFNECNIEGLDANDIVLVYNQRFINDYFYEEKGINGIFTLSKENAEAKKIITVASKIIQEKSEKSEQLRKQLEERERQTEKLLEDYRKKAWNIKKDYSDDDKVLDFCLEGFKGSLGALFTHLCTYTKNGEIEYDVESLKTEAESLKGELKAKPIYAKVNFNAYEIENNKLMSKVIVGDKESTVGTVIEKLQNSNWVNQGLQYIIKEEEVGICPFCQQKTITNEFVKQIKEYFDESYEEDKRQIAKCLEDYEAKAQELDERLVRLENEINDKELREKIEECHKKINTIIANNIRKLNDKKNNPSIIIDLDTISTLEDILNVLIEEVNKKNREYNNMILDVKGAKRKIKKKFWQIMRNQYDDIVELYDKENREYARYKKKAKEEVESLERDIEEQKTIIRENQKRTVNINDAIDRINAGLIDLGITDFRIEEHSEEEALYRIRRGECNEGVFDTLSEGEKMIISFLYFIELCKGTESANQVINKKIVVIDDPISSLSHIYVFNIGRLIKKEILSSKEYDQVFVLTHSLYFFYELTEKEKEQRGKQQKLFRIIKNDESSEIISMGYEEIQNDYQAYWSIVKDESQKPALIANCMRNIIEYFFSFVEQQPLNNVFQKKELQETRFQAFYRYMNRESHSDGRNIFDMKEFDYNQFKDAFKMVFYSAGYKAHYDKMIK